MSAQFDQATSPNWQRWFPAAAPGQGNRWRLVRFEHVDDDGKPIGKAITCMTPGGLPRLFHTEASAMRCAVLVNEEDGL